MHAHRPAAVAVADVLTVRGALSTVHTAGGKSSRWRVLCSAVVEVNGLGALFF